MSRNRPLTCKEVKFAAKTLGFRYRNTEGSHEHWIHDQARGLFRKMTIDCPKAPFTQFLIRAMAGQAGITKKELYAAVQGVCPKGWPKR